MGFESKKHQKKGYMKKLSSSPQVLTPKNEEVHNAKQLIS